jgi:hypothetical protein
MGKKDLVEGEATAKLDGLEGRPASPPESVEKAKELGFSGFS